MNQLQRASSNGNVLFFGDDSLFCCFFLFSISFFCSATFFHEIISNKVDFHLQTMPIFV